MPRSQSVLSLLSIARCGLPIHVTEANLPMLGLRAALAVMVALTTLSASAQVYTGHTAGGTVVLSNFRGADTPTLVISAPAGPAAGEAARVSGQNARSRLPAQQVISSIVSDVAYELDIPAHLLHAMIAVESGYNAHALSPKGAQGLMQLMPATARRFGVADPFDARENVRGGASYLKWLLNLFDGDLPLALAGYNAGEGAVVRAGYRMPPYAETQRYVPRVMAHLKRSASD
ncbi:MAG: lytic transglycosylase domain-containing protein [Burkholderiaceae bacterium]